MRPSRRNRRRQESQFSCSSELNDIVRRALGALLAFGEFGDVPGPRAVIIEDGVLEKRVVENLDHLAVAAMLGSSEGRPNIFPWDQSHCLAIGKPSRHVLNGGALIVRVSN